MYLDAFGPFNYHFCWVLCVYFGALLETKHQVAQNVWVLHGREHMEDEVRLSS